MYKRITYKYLFAEITKMSSANSKVLSIQPLIAGISSLMIVHTFGRFAFTPLLPHFIQDQMLTVVQGADLATINYLGYFIGALLAVRYSNPLYIKKLIIWGLFLNSLLTLYQCFISSVKVLCAVRFFNGVTNGVVFVLAPALLLEWFVSHNKTKLSGLVYLGVGIGLLATGFLIEYSSSHFKSEKRWIPIAILSVLLTLYSIVQYIRIQIPPNGKQKKSRNQKLFYRRTIPLFLAYIGAGLGYIIPMTFLPTLVQKSLSNKIISSSDIWIITSVACILFIPFWNWIGYRYSDRLSLIYSYFAQSIGVALLVTYPSVLGIVACAVLVGGSFLGSVMSTQRLARSFFPEQGPKVSALLVTIYAGSQLISPWMTKLWIQNGGSLLQCFFIGLIAFVWGLFWAIKIPNSNATVANRQQLF